MFPGRVGCVCVRQDTCVPCERALNMDCESLSMQGDELQPHVCIWSVQIRVTARKCESICEYYQPRVGWGGV